MSKNSLKLLLKVFAILLGLIIFCILTVFEGIIFFLIATLITLGNPGDLNNYYYFAIVINTAITSHLVYDWVNKNADI